MFLKTGTYSVWPSRFEPSPRTAPIASLSIPPLLDLSRLSNSALSLSRCPLSPSPLPPSRGRRLASGGGSGGRALPSARSGRRGGGGIPRRRRQQRPRRQPPTTGSHGWPAEASQRRPRGWPRRRRRRRRPRPPLCQIQPPGVPRLGASEVGRQRVAGGVPRLGASRQGPGARAHRRGQGRRVASAEPPTRAIAARPDPHIAPEHIVTATQFSWRRQGRGTASEDDWD